MWTSVDVVECDGKWPALPPVNPAALAPSGLQLCLNEPAFQLRPGHGHAARQSKRKLRRVAPQPDVTPRDRLAPGRSAAPEALATFSRRMPGPVVVADLRPVVPGCVLGFGFDPEPPGVVADRALAHHKDACDLGDRPALGEQSAYARPGHGGHDGVGVGRSKRTCVPSDTACTLWQREAARQGLEPRFHGPEPCEFPLFDPAVRNAEHSDGPERSPSRETGRSEGRHP